MWRSNEVKITTADPKQTRIGLGAQSPPIKPNQYQAWSIGLAHFATTNFVHFPNEIPAESQDCVFSDSLNEQVKM
jgi:hypothetical protein